MRVPVTGSDGYIGAVLCPHLLAEGYDVVSLDSGFDNRGWLYCDRTARIVPLTCLEGIRRLTIEYLVGFDAVVHLAELPRDPHFDIDWSDVPQFINDRDTTFADFDPTHNDAPTRSES